MKARLSTWSQRYLTKYEAELLNVARQTELARDAVESVAVGTNAPILLPIGARAKSLDSLRAKLRRHTPHRKLYDRIGVRIICHYVSDIDPLVEQLKLRFDWDRELSKDRRLSLGTKQFGYRSVHLVVQMRDSSLGLAAFSALRGEWFEIQVRSLLEHAWAEIEHEVRYKARMTYPTAVERQLNAVAGTLELLDSEFGALRMARDKVVTAHRDSYALGAELNVTFDAARLMGFLEATRPSGLSWADAVRRGKPFRVHSETACLEALASVGIGTAKQAGAALRSRQLQNDLVSYASATGLAVTAISHPVVAVLAAASMDPQLVVDSFPELLSDEPLTRLVMARASPRPRLS